jgi:hypothetical protein
MCGAAMRLVQTDHVVRLPGHAESTTQTSAEWVCSECDYFEEAEAEGT